MRYLYLTGDIYGKLTGDEFPLRFCFEIFGGDLAKHSLEGLRKVHITVPQLPRLHVHCPPPPLHPAVYSVH